jgi:hypothetical protein
MAVLDLMLLPGGGVGRRGVQRPVVVGAERPEKQKVSAERRLVFEIVPHD